MRKNSLKFKMLFAICGVVLISYSITISYIAMKATRITITEAEEKAHEIAEKFGGQIEANINNALDTTRTLSHSFEGLKYAGMDVSRSYLHNIIKSVLTKNEDFIGIGSCWEPNALDGKDAEFAGTKGHDSTGRFIPYWNRGSGTIALEPLVGYENADWYSNPKSTGRENVTSPYFYPIGGKDVLMSTAIVPIKINGTFLGATAIDISLEKFKELISGIKPFGTGFAVLITNDGVVVAHPDGSKAGKNISELGYGDQVYGIEKAVKNGEMYEVRNLSLNGKRFYKVFAPIKIGNTGVPWSIGVAIPHEKMVENANKLRNMSIILGFMGFFILICVVWFISERIVINPILVVVKSLKDIARGEGDLTKRMPVNSEDEVGALSYWFNNFMDKLQPMIKEITGNADTVSATSADILSLTEKITTNSGTTLDSSKRVTEATEELDRNMASVASAMEQASVNVSTVASAAEEMHSTIREIAQNTEKAHSITASATERADETTKSMEILDLAAQEISKITDTISDISEQTNLLALNATIEAARAGDAGKGFAVVASEIKDLATQTSQATNEISDKISRVQEASNKGIDLIKEIAGIIHDVDASVSSIAAAVEQQSAATEEVAANANQVSEGIQDVNTNIAEVNTSTGKIAEDVANVNFSVNDIFRASVEARNSSDEQSHVSEKLNTLTGEFKVGEKPFDIGKVKITHLIWVTVVDEVLGGRKKMDVSEVVSHTECPFGIWYFGEGQKFKDVAIFKDLGVYHERVHTIVKEIVGHYNNGEKARAEALIPEFTQVRRNLFDCLDELYKH